MESKKEKKKSIVIASIVTASIILSLVFIGALKIFNLAAWKLSLEGYSKDQVYLSIKKECLR